MVVLGEGENIPYIDKYIYDSSKVIAVIEVKKNLFSKDINDSYNNLKTVIKVTELADDKTYHSLLLRDSWRLIFKKELQRRNKLKDLPIEKEMFYHILLSETFYPTRIVWGYNGFKSEFSLRESFVRYLGGKMSTTKKIGIRGFGPLNFPNLIRVCL